MAVSVGCSRFISCLTNKHRHPNLAAGNPPPPQPPSPSNTFSVPQIAGGGAPLSAARSYLLKARQIELELEQLGEWLTTEKKKLTNSLREEDDDDERRPLMMRLEDGSYLREIKNVGRPWRRLAMHISSPAVAESSTSPSADEVLREMMAMEPEELQRCLKESLGSREPGTAGEQEFQLVGIRR